MVDLSTLDSEDLKQRGTTILTRLDGLFKEIGPKLTEIGQLREEFAMISDELERRGQKDGK